MRVRVYLYAMAARRRHKQYAPTIDAELDLHGHTGYEAERELDVFLDDARHEGWLRVRIIVGKGTHSRDGQPVLPDLVKSRLNARGLDYTYAKQHEGGEGALVVRLA